MENSQFTNNLRSIVFTPYQYTNFNYIKTSKFNSNPTNVFNELEYNSFVDIVFIEAQSYKLANITNNVFNNTRNTSKVTGILSANSEFLVESNTFNDLSTGVDISGVNPLLAVNVHSNTFNRCIKGVYGKGIIGSYLYQNIFNVPANYADTTYGMYLLDCNMYNVDENTFNGSPSNKSVGMYIYNTDPLNNTQTNQVYRNTFNNLNYASFGNGENTDANAGQGLTFKCNTYLGNDYDILTTVAPGISTQQGANGSTTTLAGNKFTDACGAVTDGELYNAAVVGTPPNSYQYWYHNTATYIPDAGCYTPSQVNPTNALVLYVPSGTGESCPTNFGGSGCPCPGCCRDSIRQLQFANTNTINQLTSTLDGGNTTVLTTVISAGTQPVGQLKNLLMQNSPLSSAVLIALINSNYSAGIIKEVLLQNSPLSNQVLYALLTRQPQLSSGIVKDILQQSDPLASEIMALALANNYPGGITNQLINNQQNAPLPPSVTQVTESYIGELTRENNLLTNQLVRLFLHDVEDEFRFDSISVLLKTGTGGGNPGCRACAVEADVMAKNFTTALQEISVMEQQGTELEFASLQRALIDMETMPDKLMSIKTDSILKTTIEEVALQTTKKGSINAKNLLDMAFHDKVKETYHFPQNNTNKARILDISNSNDLTNKNEKSTTIDNINKFNVYPNPNGGIFTLNYEILDDRTLELQLINLMGTIVYQTLLENTTTIKKINTTFLSNGIYFLSVNDINGPPLYKSKLSIIK